MLSIVVQNSFCICCHPVLFVATANITMQYCAGEGGAGNAEKRSFFWDSVSYCSTSPLAALSNKEQTYLLTTKDERLYGIYFVQSSYPSNYLIGLQMSGI